MPGWLGQKTLVVILFISLNVACSGGGRSVSNANDVPATDLNALGQAISGPQGIPIPQTATPQGSPVDSFLLPTGTQLKTLDAWYEHQMPTGRGWQDWKWCERQESKEDASIWKSYSILAETTLDRKMA